MNENSLVVHCISDTDSEAETLHVARDRPIMPIFYLLCYAAVLIKFTYYAQNYAQQYSNLHEYVTTCSR